MSVDLHRYTPTLSVIDPRGLAVRNVAYHRLLAEGSITAARVNRQAFNATRHLSTQWDARFWAEGGATEESNQRSVYSLTGQMLRSESVDAGWRVQLFGETSQALEGWDGRSTHRRTVYDEQSRPRSVHEQLAEGSERCVERFEYGTASESANNRCGRLTRHHDAAGSRTFTSYGLLGQSLVQNQHFLVALDTPDWPESIPARESLLEPQAYTTRSQHDAVGASLDQTNAVGNTQAMRYDVAGEVAQVSLTPLGATQSTSLLHSLVYTAFGQVASQLAGNNVTTEITYSAVDGRLQRLSARRPNRVLQDLQYSHDPLGNVLSLEDKAQPTQWFDGQIIEPISTYHYDTLYQLVEASGRESVAAGLGQSLPALGGPGGTADASRLRNYIQSYSYDAGGNLSTLIHRDNGGPVLATRTMAIAELSNRSRFWSNPEELPAPDLDHSFDANGNLLILEGAQTMAWDARNQLECVTQVRHADGAADDELYVYDASGQRRRKVRAQQAKAVVNVAEVRYLPGLELRTNTASGEMLQLTTVPTGRSEVRYLQWQASEREALPTPQWRYSVDDHLGSSALELDAEGDVISQEGYYPYGGTAWWAARNQTEADYKTIRYSGKERDATGLYYYGYRYYAPWLSRWINPDPAGDIDGLNVYCMVGNNPIIFSDSVGLNRTPIDKFIHQIWIGENSKLLSGRSKNINKTAELASDYKVTLHLDTTNAAAYEEVIKELNVDINYLSEDSMFTDFMSSPSSTPYNDFKSSPKNIPFSADLLRVRIIREKGGLYMDGDDALADADTEEYSRLGSYLEAAPNEVLTMSPVIPPWKPLTSKSLLINNNAFAAHAGNEVLARMEEEAVKRYQGAVDSGLHRDPLGLPGTSRYIGLALLWNKSTDDRLNILSNIVGPQLFTDVLTSRDPELATLLEDTRNFSPGNDPSELITRMSKKMPLGRYIVAGCDSTWR